MLRALTEILIAGPETDVEGFRNDFLAATRTWFGRIRSRQPAARRSPEERSPVANWLIAVMRAARANGYRVPAGVLAIYRTLLTAETVAQRLDPRVNLRTVGRAYFTDLQVRDAMRAFEPGSLRNSAMNILTLLRDASGQLNQILSDLAEGRLTIRVSESEEMAARHARNQRTRLVTAAVASVGLAFLVTAPPPAAGGIPARAVLAALLALLYLWMGWQWRKLR
jgi:predicted unusual protein kinase regulating ubiquinone biosynthesis (AarF/ABC1/UbiB family)